MAVYNNVDEIQQTKHIDEDGLYRYRLAKPKVQNRTLCECNHGATQHNLINFRNQNQGTLRIENSAILNNVPV